MPNIALQQSNEDELKVDDNEFQVIKTEPKNDDNCLPTALTSPGITIIFYLFDNEYEASNSRQIKANICQNAGEVIAG